MIAACPLHLFDEAAQPRPVDESDVSPTRESLGLLREAPRGDDKASRRAPRSHHSVELAHDIHAYFERAPLLALN
jgi:hypothetical protein